MNAVHISPYSGSWYPERAEELSALLDDLFERSRQRHPFLFSQGAGFVVPHAGPVYSGTVAASAYRAISEQAPERVVLIAFPHRGDLRGIVTPDVAAIATPLGEIEIDAGFAGFPSAPEDHVCDHSFEIQLPFLQKAAPQARVTPVYVGRVDAAERAAAAGRLAALWRPGVVFVASSDFTHYGREFGFTPFPPDHAAPERLRNLDFECIESAGALDSTRFLEALEETGATVCGAGPISLLLDVLRRIDADIWQATLDYQTSGEITNDFHHSVSYACLGFFDRSAFDLCPPDCEVLLDSVAETLKSLRSTGERRSYPAAGGSAALGAHRGVFVCLHQDDDLLGCIGNIEGRGPLAEVTADLALSAALDDPRFRPAASVSGPLDIEISVLTPLRRIRTAAECCPGKHGLYLKLGNRGGVLLPQVAAERGWTAEEFLGAVSHKAMLGRHAWRDPEARLYVFEAQVFSRIRAIS